MIFTLEPLRAKKGDSLLLHVGEKMDPDDPDFKHPALIVIDGGPSGVYSESLRPRLEEIRKARTSSEALPIRMMMVSHIDDDHIRGIIELTDHLKEQLEDHEAQDYRVRTLWHNSFDDVVGNGAEAMVAAASSEVGVANLSGEINLDFENLSQHAALVLASVGQGRTLRNNASFLDIGLNQPLGKVVAAARDGKPVQPDLVPDLKTHVICPSMTRIEKLQEEWDKELEKKGLAISGVEAAAYVDESVFNLASIVVLLECEGKEMLLTGDARGDDVLEGMEEAGLLPAGGTRHLDLLKLPHHGSDRNVETDFFRRLTADHYVISGDGSFGNPEIETFRMLFEARKDTDRSFNIYLTYPPADYRAYRGKDYPVDELEQILAGARQDGLEFEIITPDEDKQSIRIDLSEELEG